MTALPKILCVDDETSILESLERVFKTHFTVLTRTNAADAMTALDENTDTTVVLSDYRMPGQNGVDFLREVRQKAPLISRAILSGQMDLHQVSEAINNQDIHKFFLKPWENDYLAIQMIEALQLHRTLSERAHFEQLAITDPVTLVSNHRYFQDQFRKDLSAQPNTTLLIFDVDHFKAFNDRFGHPEGDRLLKWIAQNLETLVQKEGFVSRYGGEEFTVVLPGQDEERGMEVGEKIRSFFENTPFTNANSTPSFVTISAGLASAPIHGQLPNELIENADRALYQAKRQGRNQVAIATAR